MPKKPRLSISNLLLLGFFTVGLAVFALQNSGPDSQLPKCNGEVMSPGDQCIVYENGSSHTDTYEDRVKSAKDTPTFAALAGVCSLLPLGIGIWMIVSYLRKKAAYDEAMQRHVQAVDENWRRRFGPD